MTKSHNKGQLQFELWQECNNHCLFCYNSLRIDHTPEEVKLKSMEGALEKISDLSIYEKYDTLAYLGGEFFQGQLNSVSVREKFFELMQKTEELYENGYITEIWMYATMTIGDQKDLFNTLELFKKPIEDGNFWILTSYDTFGRFHTLKMEKTWCNTMQKLRENYKNLRLNVTSILSQDLIEKYLDGRFSFKAIMDKYDCVFFLKQPGNGDFTKEEMEKRVGNFFLKRNDFLKFLRKFKNEESDDMWTKLFNIKYRADTLYRNYNDPARTMELTSRHKDIGQEEDGCALAPCGHLTNYQAYIDSDCCVICDRNMLDGDWS